MLGPLWACVLVAVCLLLTAFLGPRLGAVFGLGPALRAAAQLALVVLLLALLVDQLALPWRCALEGRQHYRTLSVVTGTAAVLLSSGAILTVLAGGRLVAVAVVTAVLVLLRSVAVVLLARAVAPRLGLRQALRNQPRGHPRDRRTALRATRREWGTLAGYGLPVQITSLTGVVNLEADRFVLGGLAGSAGVAGFEAGARWAAVIRLVPVYALTALFPLAARTLAHLDPDEGRRWLHRVHRLTGRYLAVAAGTGAALLVVGAPQIIVLTLGRLDPIAVATIRILAPAYAVNLVSGSTAVALRVRGRPGRETRYALLAAGTNLALTFPMYHWWGAVGIPSATAVGVALGTFWFLFGRGAGEFRLTAAGALDLGRPLCAAALGAALAGWLAPADPPGTGLAAVVTILVVRTALVLAGTAGALGVLGFFDAAERSRWTALRHPDAWFGTPATEVGR